jgi:hypothetical protein
MLEKIMVKIQTEEKTFELKDDEFDKILSMAISMLGRLDDASPMEKRALTMALKMESR